MKKKKKSFPKKIGPASDSISAPVDWQYCRQYTCRTHLLQ